MASIVPAGTLAYGMQLQVQAKSKTFVEEWEADAGAAELAAIVRKADETGFFYVAVCDHLAVTKPLDAHMGTTWYDTVATLGWIAGMTERVRIMSHVFVLSYRHPLHTAKSFMTLDELSGGRAILGVGAGHLEGEFDLLGLDFAERGRVTDAAIDVVREALANEYPDIDTPYWGHLSDGGMAPRPRQSPLPIWVGGSSKPALRRAAERGDGWLPQGTPRDDMPDQIAFLLERPRTADVYAATDGVRVLSLSEGELRKMIQSDPALTAHLLHLNGIIGATDVMDAQTLPAVEMPNRDGFDWVYPAAE